MSPGSVPPNATEIYQKGSVSHRSSYAGGGTTNFVGHAEAERISEMFMGDLGAQIAACTVGAQDGVAKRHGNDY